MPIALRIPIALVLSRNIIVKAKIAAASESKSVKDLLMDLVETHWQELEKKGLLPKGK